MTSIAREVRADGMHSDRRSALRRVLDGQMRLCRAFDRLLPAFYSLDGNRHFRDVFVPNYLRPRMKVYDIGGGKNPYLAPERKGELSLTVVGIDIDAAELERAPAGAYDERICADITQYQGTGDADLVICQALLEHVKDVESAFASLSGIVRTGGRVLLFTPSRHALFARLNKLLPERLKKKLLYFLFPGSRAGQGFRSYYNKCSLAEFRELAGRHGLRVEQSKPYYMSDYFSFFFPAYALWRLWVVFFRFFAGERAAESFSLALVKDAA